MLTHRGFSAWIVVDGNPLQEHLVAIDDSSHRVSCWIPSEEGKTFSVYWKDHGGGVETCGYITLDGYLAPGRFLNGEGITWREGVRTSAASERPFMFQGVDEKGSEDSGPVGKDVGTIVLRIKRVKFVAAAPPNDIQGPPSMHKGKNGMRIGLGAEQPCFEQHPSTWRVEPYDNPGQTKPSTYVSFVFRYRSPDFLRAQGIIEDAKIPAAPLIERPSQRRFVSMPTNGTLATITPSPSPPPAAKKPLIDPVYYRLGPQRLKHPTADTRRAVSLMVPAETEEKPVNYPGEGLIIFPVHRVTTNQLREGSQSMSSTADTMPAEPAV